MSSETADLVRENQAKEIWERLYPERSAWVDLGEEAKAEWRRFVRIAAEVLHA